MEVLPKRMDHFLTHIEKNFRWYLVGVLSLAVVLRLPLLHGSFWLDEAAQALESARPWTQQLVLQKDFQPPLFHLVVHVLQYVSRSESWLRLASLLPALGSIGIAMAVARDRWGKAPALAAGLMLAVSSFHVFYSQELRPYMLATFLCALSWLAYERWIWSPTSNARRWQAVFIVSIVSGWYTSYVTIFWLPVFLALTLLWRRKGFFPLVFSSGVSVLLYLPWLPFLREQLQVGAALRESLPGWDAVVSLSAIKSIPLTAIKFLVGQQTVDFTVGQVLLYGSPFGLAIFAGAQAMREKKRSWSDLGSLVLLAGLPILLAWIFSFMTPVLAPKRIMFVLPVWAVLLGWLTAKVPRWGAAVLVAWLVFQAVSLTRYWTDPQLQREDWRGMIQAIEQRFSPDRTAVVMAFEGPFAPWEWYATEPYPLVVTGIEPLKESEKVHEKLQPVLANQQVLVFDYLRDLTDPYRLIDATLQDAGYQEITALDGKQIGFIRVFTQNRLYAGRNL